MHRTSIGFLVISILVIGFQTRFGQIKQPKYSETSPVVQGSHPDVLSAQVILDPPSSFQNDDEVVEEELPFDTKFEDDPEQEIGYQEIKQKGVDGKRITTYQTTFWEGELVSKEVANVEVTEPVDEIILKGVKTVIRNLDTADVGSLNYVEKLTVWATSYDGNCVGCSGRTATGKAVTVGICATDPEVIPLGTKFYVPGYGMCSAEDRGGAIRGNKIDVGFEDVRQGWWSARYTDIYILP